MTSKLSPAEVERFTSRHRWFDEDAPSVWVAQRRVADAVKGRAGTFENEFFRDESDARARYAEMIESSGTVRARLMHGVYGAMSNVDTFGAW